MNFHALKFQAKVKLADALGMFLPETIQAKLSGLGEPPQLGNAATLVNIQNAIRYAERGEVYYMFALFRDMIQNMPHLQAEMGKRIMSFMGQTETIEPIDKNNPDDVKAAEVIQEMIDNCDNWREGSMHLANGHIWPIAGCEKIYQPVSETDIIFKNPVRYRLKKLHPIPYALYNYKVSYWNVNTTGADPNGGTTPMGILTNSGAMPIQQVGGVTALNNQWMRENNNEVLIWNPEDWHADLRFYGTFANGLIDWTMSNCYKPDPVRHVLHSANVATSQPMRENFGGVLRSLLPFFLYEKSGFDWFARAMERYASPFAVAYANTANKNVFDLLTKAFNQATKVNALIVPPQAKIELKEVMASGMADAYSKFIEVCNTEITKAILGQTLSTSSKGSGMMGGSGVADLHSDVKEEWALFDKRAYCDMQRKQIFDPYLKINGYKGKCRAVRGGINPSQQALMAKTLQSLYLSGIRVAKSEEQVLTNTYGIKLEVFDPQENQDAGGRMDKSAADHKNPNKGSIP